MKDKIMIISTLRSACKNTFYKMFMDSKKCEKPTWVGIDWASENCMIRGEVIKREGNVTYLRFKTVTV